MNKERLHKLIHIVLIAVNTIIALCLLLSAFGGAVDPATCAFMQVIGMTLPIWTAAEIAMLVLTFILWRKGALIPLAALIISSPAILAFSPLHIGSRLTEAERERSFTLMTYNVYGYIDHELSKKTEWGSRSIQQIIATQPDMVCLQEGSNSLGGKAQRDSLQAIYPYIAISSDNGEIFLSKYPFTVLPTPQPKWLTAHYDAYQVNVEGHQLIVVNCHLESIGLSPDDKALYRELTDKRLSAPSRTELSKVKTELLGKLKQAYRMRAEQARHIRQFLDEHPGNAILAGDFNDVQGNYAYRTICDGDMRDAYSDCAFGPTITYIDNHFYFHIDQILYRGDMRAVDITRGNIKSSDHYPLTATFVWNPSDISGDHRPIGQ